MTHVRAFMDKSSLGESPKVSASENCASMRLPSQTFLKKNSTNELSSQFPMNLAYTEKSNRCEEVTQSDGCTPLTNQSKSPPGYLEKIVGDFDEKCRRIADLIAHSKTLVAFTGAGISTSTGLPDYRGENGIRTSKKRKLSDQNTDLNHLVPSKTHMALVELHRLGLLHHVISQNIDNLHLKSGLSASVLTEVHGNATHAICETCEKVYMCNFPCNGLCNDPKCESTRRPMEQRIRARTRHGNGRLRRHVISFDQPLGDIDHAIEKCEEADVALVLGTSLRVEPFCEMAGEFADSLVIVNLQKTTTKLDRRAELSGARLYADCDTVMTKVMQYVMKDETYQIPPWQGQHEFESFVPEREERTLNDFLTGKTSCA
uniref:protein acetyllysine N-acetyltransferase n=1 Tax=Albugo laibachii Nc14 TaxID=890382 RepID=F0WBH3_9STRA|nr:monoADPribosyltransferase sirtuin6like protein putat [Albugo laibachii Nc14]|eukprot:CCA18499.1 monoADPribosyltransferase sirtuin6like protein putat [Albugo laibachii Nc14]